MSTVFVKAMLSFFQPQLSSLNETVKLYDSLSRHIMLVDKFNDMATMSVIAVFHTLNL